MVWPWIWFPNELRVLSASLLLPRLRMLRLQRFVEYLALFAVVPHLMTCLYKNKTSHLCPVSLVKGRWRRSAGGIPACCRLLSFNHPVGAGHARPAHFRKPLLQSQTTTSYANHPGHISLRPRGISRALKTARGAVFAPRYAGRGARAFRFPHGSPFTPDTY